MDSARRLKQVDKIFGTPLCYILGALSYIGRLLRRAEKTDCPRKILLIKTVAIGDLVVALPSFKAIRDAFPSAHITLLTTPRVRQVVEDSPFFDEIIYFDPLGQKKESGLISIARKVRAAGFDIVIDFEHYYRFTTLLAYFSKAPMRVGFDLPWQGRGLLFTRKIPYPIEKHEVETFLELAGAVGASTEKQGLVEIAISAQDNDYTDELAIELGLNGAGTVIGIHPTTSPVAMSRRWPAERFAQLADELVQEEKATIVFTGAPADKELVENIRSKMNQHSVSTVGRSSLKQFAALTKKMSLFISLDTGPMHIAAAMGTKVIGLFGPNTPVKWGPYGSGNHTVTKNLDCSPCTKQYLGQVSKCSTGDCMLAISVEDVKLTVIKGLSELDSKNPKAQST